jgi:60 kDa SS-A/Ro ribonucleoprotein
MAVQKSKNAAETARLIREYRLPREALPTEHLNDVQVWKAMLDTGMPMTAMIRNLANMTRNGTLDDPAAMSTVLNQLGNEEAIRKSRVHPMTMLVALKTYAAGHGMQARGTSWVPKPQIVDALDEGFYLAFGNVVPTGKSFLLALDVSGSMSSGQVAGSFLTPREASAAMAMVTVATEKNVEVVAFADARYHKGAQGFASPHAGQFSGGYHGISDGLWPVGLSKRRRLDDVVTELASFHMGGTDCALPFLYAIDKGKAFDAFIVYTDSETWAGAIHPKQALDQYRQRSGINARSVVVGMVSNDFSIADPSDAGMLDVVGFDTATPNLISEFVTGNL